MTDDKLTIDNASEEAGRGLFAAGVTMANARRFIALAESHDAAPEEEVQYFQYELESLRLFYKAARARVYSSITQPYLCRGSHSSTLLAYGDYLRCVECGATYYLDDDLRLHEVTW